jgi:hypothetical protein
LTTKALDSVGTFQNTHQPQEAQHDSIAGRAERHAVLMTEGDYDRHHENTLVKRCGESLRREPPIYDVTHWSRT